MLPTLQIDAAEIGQAFGIAFFGEADLLFVLVEDLNRQGQTLELFDEHLEGFRNARLEDLLPFHG